MLPFSDDSGEEGNNLNLFLNLSGRSYGLEQEEPRASNQGNVRVSQSQSELAYGENPK